MNIEVKEFPRIDAEDSRKPPWLKIRLHQNSSYRNIKNLMTDNDLHTVCEEAQCPNMNECWNRGTATFMILGDICTRSCGFCAVKTGRPPMLDEEEPKRVVDAALKMDLNHVVVTSVNRDERKDGGAPVFADTITRLHDAMPDLTVEVLIPDFKGNWDALQIVIDAEPEILNHNMETVERIYKKVRPQAKYTRSLELLYRAKQEGMRTKSGIMVGIGEETQEVVKLMQDLREVDVDIMTIGQYLQPSQSHLPVDRYVHPDEFNYYRDIGLRMGFDVVESGPMVRSSYHADEQASGVLN
ncbi:MAG: lipoyl synthase [Candidatus Marinimicrobia bacterium]|nr:lipoyl synthase [Candidatus Neomarinimicrobiota bacterium]MCF7828401.1 lipoyl synthase [Candidatus Neomarinimicrobiota bacterium]MCF7881005.1 lipoyl synthase [Candidatus Neomarinimicrobiota bacterium]